ncbi:MAG: succinate--CoA ligase subunit beta [Eubacterium sp.]|nr:succinate--CoA ligase subunit beta [Eubacterium sp.]
MDLYEFEGKGLLSQYGIPVPESGIIFSPDAEVSMPLPLVLKAQVLTGGRGKAGGVRVCRTDEELERNKHEIFDLSIKGHTVRALLTEKLQPVDRELYLSITMQGVARPTLIASASGGMDIEQVAKETPDKILKMEIDIFTGLKQYQKKYAAKVLGVPEAEMIPFLDKLQEMFFDTGAKLIEINPLGVCEGKLVAMDAKVSLDDNVKSMASAIEEIKEDRKVLYKWEEPFAEPTTITFVPLEGDIGLISDGAGTGMLSLDLITDAGGKVASFCELGGITNADVMYRALQLTLESGIEVKSVIVVLIGGFNRMDQMAEGIVRYMKEHDVKVPVFTRMCGTYEEEGKAMMADAGFTTYYNLMETVQDAVDAAREV